MSFFEEINDAVSRLRAFAELDVDTQSLPQSVQRLSDASVHELLSQSTALVKQATLLQAVLAGVASSRSRRDRGDSGFTQGSGHRNAIELIRDLTGTTRGEATRAVKVGEALLDGHDATDGTQPVDGTPTSGGSAAGDQSPTGTAPWHEPLRDALLRGTLTTAQHHAIRGGLGDPPPVEGRTTDAVIEAWRAAARELAVEAASCRVEDLAARARGLRDMLDPMGAEERYAARFTQRSYRWSTTTDGLTQAHITFDDEMAAWVRGLTDAALSPRRGGPRFVSQDEQDAALALVKDPRTNDQLAYDLFTDVLRAGALARAADVFGTREVGVRLVTIRDSVTGAASHRDAFGRLIATAQSDDGSLSVPGSVLDRALCTTSTIDVTVDSSGGPLDVGRMQRLFTAKQRVALAVRDGGCIWPGCDRPPAYCEAHHCDSWSSGGSTNCDTGVLLCRYHHLHLHNSGSRIARADSGGFVLHAPAGSGVKPTPLRSRSPLRWLWDPPPKRAAWRLVA